MSTRKFLISIVLVVAMLIVLGTTSVKAVDFKLTVNYDKSSFDLDVSDTTLVSEVKTLIKEAKGIDESKQRLSDKVDIFSGVSLEDNKMLADYNITSEVKPNSHTWISLREFDETAKKYTSKSIKPETEDNAYIILTDLLAKDGITPIFNAEQNFTKFEGYDDKYYYTNITVTYNYDNNIKTVVDKLTKNIPEDQDIFKMKDFEIVNFWVNGGKQFYYSSELMSCMNNKNFEFNELMGDTTPFASMTAGPVTLKYDGTIYYARYMLGVEAEHVLYVPTNTAKADYLKVMQERVDNYIGKGKAVISDCGTVEQDTTEYPIDPQNPIFEKSSDGHVYKMTIGENSFYFVIKADTESMYTPTFISSDVATDVAISANSGTLPLDTLIRVNEITGGDQYEKIMKILELENGEIYDLKLFSQALEKNITKLEDGSFEVRIPLSEKLKGKDLVAYYLDDNGNKEEHEVTIKDGYAVFNTNHFSTYTLAEKPAETPDETPIETPDNTPKGDDNTNNENEKDETPKTGTEILAIESILGILAVVLASAVIIAKRENK